MYQHVFQTQGVMHFESGKTPRVMRYVVSDDPHWASGYHMHENETELIWVERGTVEVMVNANKYVAHAGDIIALEHGKFHMLASSDADPAKTFTCAVYGFKFHDVRGESLILEPDSVPVVHAALGVDTIRTLFREFDTLVTQANPLVDILGNLIATLLTVLFRENFKLAARPGKDKQLKNALIRDVLVYLNENYREKITLEALSKRFRASVSYIAHEFAREYGVSPINYVIERRITEAKFGSLQLRRVSTKSPGISATKILITSPNSSSATSAARLRSTVGALARVRESIPTKRPKTDRLESNRLCAPV